ANCYVYKQIIKIIDTQDPIINACPTAPVVVGDLTPNDPQFYNANYFWDPIVETHDLCEAPGELTVSATDLCSGTDLNFSYLLFIDIDQNGSMETVISSNNLPGFNNINVGNAANQNFTGGTPSAFDFRPVPANQKYGFALQTTVSGKNKTARVAWNTAQSPGSYVTPQFPHGRHKIKWIVNDNCGNESVCEYIIEVKDGKAPTVVCINGLSVNIMPTGMITLWDTDFLKYKEDNCTPADKVITGIRRAGAGTGFPRDAQGNPIKSITFDCSQTGTQFVELWAEDLAGNADFCQTFLNVQDPNGVCQPGNKASVAGAAKTDFGNPATGVQGVDMDITGAGVNGAAPINLVSQTNNQGAFTFIALPVTGNYNLTPEKDTDPLNGVSTYDLVLISKHILGLDPLKTPYKMIAADANKSGSITTYDIVEIRKLILGIYSKLPNNTSWRFVDKSFQFPNNDNPFQTTFPETMTIAPLLAGGYNNADFVGVKVGDVNGTAIANNAVSANDRSAGDLYFDVQDQQVKAGEVVTVAFKAADATAAYQFTMNLNGLEVVDVNLNDDNYAVFTDAMTCSVDDHNGAFEVTFRATQNGTLSNMIAVSNRITKAEGYTENGERLEVAFRFDGNTVAGAGFELLQNVPNPASDLTQISFHLPEAADATLTITNVEGRIVKTINGAFNKGLNTISLNAAELESGVLFYQLDTPTHSASKKMVVVK
ncbi:MAG: T9SS type A sorting domain-containing protein, partial [Saprospiraceae bacterium]